MKGSLGLVAPEDADGEGVEAEGHQPEEEKAARLWCQPNHPAAPAGELNQHTAPPHHLSSFQHVWFNIHRSLAAFCYD
jgi:hypothetical protein